MKFLLAKVKIAPSLKVAAAWGFSICLYVSWAARVKKYLTLDKQI
jgi:hypothetical protein